MTKGCLWPTAADAEGPSSTQSGHLVKFSGRPLCRWRRTFAGLSTGRCWVGMSKQYGFAAMLPLARMIDALDRSTHNNSLSLLCHFGNFQLIRTSGLIYLAAKKHIRTRCRNIWLDLRLKNIPTAIISVFSIHYFCTKGLRIIIIKNPIARIAILNTLHSGILAHIKLIYGFFASTAA
jgi:hypothetical protein